MSAAIIGFMDEIKQELETCQVIIVMDEGVVTPQVGTLHWLPGDPHAWTVRSFHQGHGEFMLDLERKKPS